METRAAACRRLPQRRIGITVAALLPLLLAAAATLAATPTRPARLLYAEPLSARWDGAPLAHAAGSAAARGTLGFHAFGRDFQLALAPNAGLGPAPAGIVLQTGTLAGIPGSWVRLTRDGDDLIGLVYDGVEYLGIEPVANLVTVLDPDVPQPARGNMVYRLADLLIDPALLACGTGESAGFADPGAEGPLVSAAAATRALSAELATATATGPGYRLHVAPVADYEFASRFAANAVTEILARLNIADGIFSQQAGISLVADEPTVFTSTSPPYTLNATAAATLLDQLGDYRRSSGTAAGITHLFSNKTFSNQVGVAWQDTACLARTGASLSTGASLTATLSGLVAAHEIGHNLGAPHDGEAGSACESTPQTYLMAPSANGSSMLSACSLGRIAAVVSQRASAYPACLVPLGGPGSNPDPPAGGGGGGGAADVLTLLGLLAIALQRQTGRACGPV